MGPGTLYGVLSRMQKGGPISLAEDEFDAGHFHMLVDPEAVTSSLIDIIGLLCPQ